MSLDVYLTYPAPEPGGKVERIYIREDGGMKEISRAEWDRRFPDKEPVTVESENDGCVYSSNITHNLNTMAEAAGIYKELWRPEEIEITHAKMLIEPLAAGLKKLRDDPGKFKPFNPKNGWGSYEGLVAFVSEYLEMCREHPDAQVSVWK